MDGLSRRDLHRLVAVAATSLGLGGLPQAAFAGESGELGYVHPELRPAAKQLLQLVASMPEISPETLAITRQAMGGWAQPPLEHPKWHQRAIKGLPGNPDVSVFVINSDDTKRRPAILHTHGGGFISGKAISMMADLQRLALELDCTIVTVDYRLAPEVNFRGSTADNYAALQWLHDEAKSLGVDAGRIAVMGESAGGGHAALLALKARDLGKIPLVAQILIYPMLDDRTGTTKTPQAPIGTIVWNVVKNRFGWQSFLGMAPGTDKTPQEAVPARYRDLSGLPPTFIGVGAIDLFVDEDIAYANRLIDAGVPTQLEVVPGAFHGFDGIGASTQVAKDFTASKVTALRRAFA
ncbi:alpha/beta hydrolase [Novosphingobium sediminicola]|uniref:Acetyl esterase/lipase n=1 Tax=Novosphingobium sediminicola TaxID=563162 RepID=A0A7W6CH69_9SPHN|nr:alpha/beta hydrolase [Novosphingobium sediminicola]MBB3955772.1 acetyl esterase/lipase [Novosphingobium sediminicola]